MPLYSKVEVPFSIVAWPSSVLSLINSLIAGQFVPVVRGERGHASLPPDIHTVPTLLPRSSERHFHYFMMLVYSLLLGNSFPQE
jgi:hypothetical protein